jgi:hypothetical protein
MSYIKLGKEFNNRPSSSVRINVFKISNFHLHISRLIGQYRLVDQVGPLGNSRKGIRKRLCKDIFKK